MKRILIALCATVLSLGLLTAVAAETKKKPARRGPLVHMVAFKFKPDAGADKIKEVEAAFAALPDKIAEIATFETGTNVSPEKLDKGFTHGFLLTFKDDKARDAYLVHPDHKAFGALVGPVLADVFVIDFWTKKPAAKAKK